MTFGLRFTMVLEKRIELLPSTDLVRPFIRGLGEPSHSNVWRTHGDSNPDHSFRRRAHCALCYESKMEALRGLKPRTLPVETEYSVH